AKKMPYMTSIERLGREEGLQQGLQQGEILDKQRVLQRLLNKKFGLTDQERELIFKQYNPEILDNALDKIIFVNTKEEVLSVLQ
ncbi:MAG: hypothetical protein U5L00_09545, partial [Desulfovermiculus sp.]|nr:hypothetical protein [Desulfovermiculus sp.]